MIEGLNLDVSVDETLKIKSSYREEKEREESVPEVKISKERLKKYRVYRSDENDYVYTRNLYEQLRCTYQLLVSSNPVDERKCEDLYKKEFSRLKE